MVVVVVRDVNLRMPGVWYTHSILEFERSEKVTSPCVFIQRH